MLESLLIQEFPSRSPSPFECPETDPKGECGIFLAQAVVPEKVQNFSFLFWESVDPLVKRRPLFQRSGFAEIARRNLVRRHVSAFH